jgi:hypothetical protein
MYIGVEKNIVAKVGGQDELRRLRLRCGAQGLVGSLLKPWVPMIVVTAIIEL